MNIIYLGSFRFPKGDAAAARVLNNARILQELKHKVSILSFGGDKGDEWQYYEGIPYLVTSDMDTHSWKERFARYTKPYPKCRELIKQMVDDDRYCEDIIIQISAVNKSLKSIGNELLKNHLNTCVKDAIISEDQDVFDDVIDLFEKLNK